MRPTTPEGPMLPARATQMIVAGALCDLIGWLTSRDERLTLSSADPCAAAVMALIEFADLRGLPLDDAAVQSWAEAIATPTGYTDAEQAAWHAGIEAGREIERNNAAAQDPVTWPRVFGVSRDLHERCLVLSLARAPTDDEVRSIHDALTRAPVAAQETRTALDRYRASGADVEEKDPLERLRFFCSLAMSGQDWLDVEPFFDAVAAQASAVHEDLELAVAMLENGEYAEHWAKSELGKRLESALTRLHGDFSEASASLAAQASGQDREDAERYRYLRDIPRDLWPESLRRAVDLQQNAIMDQEIDAARAAAKGES